MIFNVMDTTATASQGGWGSMLIMLLVYGGIIAAMYFIFFRPQSKKKKKEQEMRKNAQVGDEVTTIGGICGRIIAVKDETESVIIETRDALDAGTFQSFYDTYAQVLGTRI